MRIVHFILRIVQLSAMQIMPQYYKNRVMKKKNKKNTSLGWELIGLLFETKQMLRLM